jgi:hypothetical protein
MATRERWSSTVDSDHHVTLFESGRIVWEGSYEALMADGDIKVPEHVMDEITDRVEESDANIDG